MGKARDGDNRSGAKVDNGSDSIRDDAASKRAGLTAQAAITRGRESMQHMRPGFATWLRSAQMRCLKFKERREAGALQRETGRRA